MVFAIGAVVVVTGCGRLDFGPVDPGIAGGGCGDRNEPNDSAGDATPLALGGSITATLCTGDVDVYAVTLSAGDELAATITPTGAGYPTLAMLGTDGRTARAVETLDTTAAAFADHDGMFYVAVGGLPTAAGTPYQLSVGLRPGNHVYIAPNGDDAAPGTFAQPWRDFDAAVGRLVPGDVLVLEDGVYGPDHGRIDVNCANGQVSGTQDQPIRIVALSERLAEVDGDGQQPTAMIEGGCQWWTIEGLHLESTTVTSPTIAQPLEIDGSTNIVARRLLVRHNNADTNSAVLQVYNSSHILVEECEAYDYTLGGIAVANGSDITIRRNFVALGHDSGFSTWGTMNARFENNMDDGGGGFSIDDGYGDDTVDTFVLGNVARGNDFGLISSIFDTTTNHNIGLQIADHVSVDSTDYGYYLRSNEQASCTRCTALDSAMVGWDADELPNQPQIMGSSSCTSCLMVNDGNTGFDIHAQRAGWSITSSNAFGNTTNFEPTGVPELVNPNEVDPALGGCQVYAPSGSPMATANVGAQILYRYVDGALTHTPLWHPITGAFACGAVVPGINDDPATSCVGLSRRLHVGTADCSLPYPQP
jgi:hypothetical protein